MPKVELGVFDDMDALLSGPRSDASEFASIRSEAALAADRALESKIKASAAATRKSSSAVLADRLSLTSEQLRGVSVTTLLAGGARLFANNGAAAREDPAGTFALSKPVPFLDYFVSHAWRSSRLEKGLALLIYFAQWPAVIAWLVGAYTAFWIATLHFELLPQVLRGPVLVRMADATQGHQPFFVQAVSVAALALVLLTWHRTKRNVYAFLDIACIDQTDAAKKESGIKSLGAILDRSERMLVIFDEHYLTRLWCIFELAAFAKRGSLDRLDVLPVHLALFKSASLLFTCCSPILLFTTWWSGVALFGPDMDVVGMGLMYAAGSWPLMIVIIAAGIRARSARQAVDRLRDFKLSDAGCASADDKAAIIELIARWWADDVLRTEDLESNDQLASGIHAFEQFVRFELRRKLEAFTPSSIIWPAECGVWLLGFYGLSIDLDVLSDPSTSLYHVASVFAYFVGFVAFVTMFGAVTNIIVGVVAHVSEKWRWPSAAAHALGVVLWTASFPVAFMLMSIGTPHILVMGHSEWQLPDDGLDPAWDRRLVKMQVVSFVLIVIVLAVRVAHQRK